MWKWEKRIKVDKYSVNILRMVRNLYICRNCQTMTNKSEVLEAILLYFLIFIVSPVVTLHLRCRRTVAMGQILELSRWLFWPSWNRKISLNLLWSFFWSRTLVFAFFMQLEPNRLYLVNWNAELQTKKMKRCCLRTLPRPLPLEHFVFKTSRRDNDREHQETVFSLLS